LLGTETKISSPDFNQDIVKSLNLKSGEEILVSVPSKNKLVLEIC
jgi:hypothetical protein